MDERGFRQFGELMVVIRDWNEVMPQEDFTSLVWNYEQMPNVPDGSESPDDAQKYQDWMEEHQKLVNKALLIVAKQRHGSTGNVPLIFQSEYTKFSSPNYRDYSDFGEE